MDKNIAGIMTMYRPTYAEFSFTIHARALMLILWLFLLVNGTVLTCAEECTYICRERLPISIPNGCKQVRNLSLRGCLMTELTPGTFVGFTFLTKLDLSHNHISIISENIFTGAPQLETIDLMYNSIDIFNQFALNGSENLQNIYLGRNFLIAVEETTFQQAPALRRINLSWNHLVILRNTTFQHLWNLEYLDLSENKLINLPRDIFTDQSLLIFLDISNNLLSTLEANHFINLVELRKLDLSGNRLISIHISIFSLPHIERLDLRENRLTHLGNETWLSHVELYLGGNPWVCDCSFQPFRSRCLWVSPFCNIIDSPVCTSPSDLTRHPMKGFINQTCHDLQNKSFIVINLTDDKKPNNENDSNYATGQDSNISAVLTSLFYMLLVLVPLCILFAYVYYSLRHLRRITHVVAILNSDSEQPTVPLQEPAIQVHCDRGDSTPSKFPSQRADLPATPSKKSNKRLNGTQLEMNKCKRDLNGSFNDSDS